MDSFDFKIIKRFGPSVLKVKIPENIINTLNDHFDKIISDKEESKRLNHGEDLVGDVTQELKLEKEIMEKSGWIKFLGSNIDKPGLIIIKTPIKPMKIAIHVLRETCSLKIKADKATTITGVREAIL